MNPPARKPDAVAQLLKAAGVLILLATIVWLFPGWAMSNYIIGAAGFVFAFGLAVFVHEFGHFIAAKAFGVRVERFVLGMDKVFHPALPNCVWERQIGETTYGISLAPLGGYVKMSGHVHPDLQRYIDGPSPEGTGEADGAAPAADAAAPNSITREAIGDQAALFRRPFYQKFTIYMAGIAMNLLTALALIVFNQVRGETVDAPYHLKVTFLPETSRLAHAGVRLGDELATVDGRKVADSEQLQNALVARFPLDRKIETTATLALSLRRPGQEGPVSVTHDIGPTGSGGDELDYLMSRPAYVDFVQLNQPADKAGIKVGDTIAEIDGVAITDWRQMQTKIRASAKKKLDVAVRRKDGTSARLSLTPWESTEEKGVGQVGIIGGNPEKVVEHMTLGQALRVAPRGLVLNARAYLDRMGTIFGRLLHLSPRTAQRELGGPVAIAQAASRTAQLGFGAFLKFLIGLNIALAVMNALPIPVLDGGHVVFAAYEGVFKKPVPPKVLVPVLEGAVLFIIAFAIIVTLNDFFKILS